MRQLAGVLIPILIICLFFLGDKLLFESLLAFFSDGKIFSWIYSGINWFTLLSFILPFLSFIRSRGFKGILSLVALGFGIFLMKAIMAPLLWGNKILFGITGSGLVFNIGLYTILGLSFLFFCWFVYGITFGKYNYKVSDVKIKIPNLPDALVGYRIAQITDVHSGSFDSKKGMQKGIKLVNDQKTDLIVFTGDLVNMRANEIEPYFEDFSKLNAPDGIFSVLGNHDYYQFQWSSDMDQVKRNYNLYLEQHKNCGFELLLNEHVIIEKGGAKLALIGVENWGDPPFPQRGDLDVAMQNIIGTVKSSINNLPMNVMGNPMIVKDADAKILLSHDPSHWEKKVIDYPTKMDLTLSGHTHAMQFGFDVLGFKWSPVKYRYKHWWGLYEQAGRHLYVNRGFGFLGFPGRVGMWPEVSVFELTKG